MQVDRLNSKGAQVSVAQVDVCDDAALGRLIHGIDRLRGVIHAAGILDDSSLLNLDDDRLRRVLDPKVRGAWNLHVLTLDRQLDFFVLFSSAASLLGSAGQASYAAANAFLDGLAHYRQRQRLPALVINWGPVAEVGLAAAQANRGARLRSEGIGSLWPQDCTRILERLLGQEIVQIAAIDLASFDATDPLFAEMVAGMPPSDTASHVRHQLSSMASAEDRLRFLEAHLTEQIVRVIKVSPTTLDIQTPFKSLGLDSLMAIQLTNRLKESLGVRLTVTSFWTYPTIEAYRDYLATLLGIVRPQPQAQPARPPGRTPTPLSMEELLAMSDEEAERMLQERS
jgi:aryl carrier-like protein